MAGHRVESAKKWRGKTVSSLVNRRASLAAGIGVICGLVAVGAPVPSTIASQDPLGIVAGAAAAP